MKKSIVIALLLTLLTMSLVACGTNVTPEQLTSSNNKANNGSVVSDKITVDDLMNAAESPEEDFEITDYGDGIVELSKYLGDDSIVVIPATVNGKAITRIGAYVFANDYHPNTKAVRLSKSIRVVDTGAFGLNETIEVFVAGDGLEEIGEGAFQGCVNLCEVILNDGLLKLGSACFSDCVSLTTIEIPDSVSEIHMMAFYPYSDGFSIVGSSGSYAERFCEEQDITFKEKGQSSFDSSNAPVIEGKITVDDVRNHSVASENDFSYDETADGIRISSYLGSDSIVVIPETINGKLVVSIAIAVFGNDSTVRGVLVPSGVKELTGTFGNSKNIEVVIWESAEVVGANLFNSCTNLHSVVLGENLKDIGENAFFSCKSLEELYIPATVASLDSYIAPTIFYWCDNLTIKGEAGSYIETFCEEYNIPFETV